MQAQTRLIVVIFAMLFAANAIFNAGLAEETDTPKKTKK